MALTKQDLENIREVVKTEVKSEVSAQFDAKFDPLLVRIEHIEKDVRGLREQIQQLAITLDNFVKMMTDYKEEFTILKAEMDQIKKVLQEKLGVTIAVQR